MAPAVSPLIIFRCSTMVMVMSGNSATTMTALICPHRIPRSCLNQERTTGSVALEEFVNIEAKRNSVQVRKIQKRAVATMPGMASGMITLNMTVALFPPSTRTDSSMERGISSKNPYIIHITIGRLKAVYMNIIPPRLSIIFNVLNNIKMGIEPYRLVFF